jgi:hypothetical protein
MLMRNGTRNGIHRSHGGGHGGHGGGSHPSVEILSQMGYETRDVSVPALLRWGGVLLVFIVVSTVGSRVLYNFVVPTYADELNQPIRHQRRVPPFPQVQPNPKSDMMAYRTAEDRVLAGKAAMPGDQPGTSIDAAMETLATQKGIAGKTGDELRQLNANSKSYPGGGAYNDAAQPTGSMESGHAASSSAAGATATPSPAATPPDTNSVASPSPAAGVTP